MEDAMGFSFLLEDIGRSDKQNFRYGTPELNGYRTAASQGLACSFATVVLTRAMDAPAVILDYCAFSAASVPIVSLPGEISRKMLRYRNVPAILLGRLAVTLSMQDRRIGSLLLFDALKRACASEVAWAISLVEAKNERAPLFYQKFRFLRSYLRRSV